MNMIMDDQDANESNKKKKEDMKWMADTDIMLFMCYMLSYFTITSIM